MPQITSPPIFFVSYARADTAYLPYRADLERFINDLSARVAVKMPTPPEGVSFFDVSSIEAGEVWTTALSQAAATSKVGVALYTPNYFTRDWCGREFQVFLTRAQRQSGSTGIVPVIWIACPTLPSVAAQFNYTDATFPQVYADVGMQQLLRLKAYADEYERAIEAVATLIVAAAKAGGLAQLPPVDFQTMASAWDVAAASDADSHKKGGITKTCFVFASTHGWHWKPYSGSPRTVGALAQQLSGELGLRYEELPYDATLPDKLQESNESNVPTVLFGDPHSLNDSQYARPMKRYDQQFLLNCAALVPWTPESRLAGDADPMWTNLKTRVCPQKTQSPPPHHEWRSIFSQEDLDLKARISIEQIRSRLMKQRMGEPSDPGAPVSKAENEQVKAAAAARGIVTESLSQLEGPTR